MSEKMREALIEDKDLEKLVGGGFGLLDEPVEYDPVDGGDPWPPTNIIYPQG